MPHSTASRPLLPAFTARQPLALTLGFTAVDEVAYYLQNGLK